MKILLIISSLFISSYAFSQKKEIEFGIISTEEKEMTSYEKDENAKAVVLYDKGKSIFFDTDKGYDIRFTRHKRIKIFSKSEAQHAEISIPYYADGYGKTEVVKSIEAVTYNVENGRLTPKKLDPSTIYEEQINDRWFNKKFVFPDVQDGAILEYRYILETPFHFNLPDWRFQDKIPTIYSEYQVSMIPFYEYVFLVQGTTRFNYQNSEVAKEKRTWGTLTTSSYGEKLGSGIEFQDYVHTYVMKDVPGFKDESYISSINNYIIKMDFQLAKFHSPRGGTNDVISTWFELNKSLLKNEKFGKYIKSSSRFAKRIIKEELELEGLDAKMKAKMIIEYVKNSFEWNGYYGKYASQSAKDFITKKKGNVADINLFLIALLNEAGIKAEPLILSTRDHGKISLDYPFDHFTNYVIALANTESLLLADGTEEFLPFNKLPTHCFNENALVVNKDEVPNWVGLNNNFLSREKNSIFMWVDTLTLDVKTKVFIQETEYESFISRKKFKDDTLSIKEYYSGKIGKVNTIKTIGYQNPTFPYSINFEGDYETEKLGDNIVIRPFMGLPLASNSLTQEKRNYPVDFEYPWKDEFESTLEIPEGFLLPELPEGYQLDNDLADIHLIYTLKDNILTAKGSYHFKKSIYVASEYARIKFYFDQIVKHFNQPIVLEAKK